MIKKLPFNNNSLIKTYPYFADYLGILDGCNINTDEFIINNFLSMNYIPVTGQVNFSKKTSLKNLFIIENFDVESSNIIAFIKENINQNRYVIILLNDNNFERKMEHPLGIHSWLVYGYNDAEKIFNVCGYIIENGCNIYKKIELRYDELRKSYPKHLTYIEKNRISSNQTCEVPNNIIEKNNKNIPKKVSVCFNLLIKNTLILLMLRIHNCFFSKMKIKPYKRNFLDLRDLRIFYEHSIAVDLYLKYNEFDSLYESNENIKLTQNNLIIATKFRLLKNKLNKKDYSKKINNNLKKINKNQILIAKKLLSSHKNEVKYEEIS